MTVKRQFNIGSRETYLKAITGGEVDVLPEYTGSLLNFFDKTATATKPDEVYATLKKAAAGLTVLDKSAAEDKNSLVVTKETADAVVAQGDPRPRRPPGRAHDRRPAGVQDPPAGPRRPEVGLQHRAQRVPPAAEPGDGRGAEERPGQGRQHLQHRPVHRGQRLRRARGPEEPLRLRQRRAARAHREGRQPSRRPSTPSRPSSTRRPSPTWSSRSSSTRRTPARSPRLADLGWTELIVTQIDDVFLLEPSPGQDRQAVDAEVKQAFEQGASLVMWRSPAGDSDARRKAWSLGFTLAPGVLRTRAVSGACEWIGWLGHGDAREPRSRWLEPVLLEHERLRLRPWRESDAPRLVVGQRRVFQQMLPHSPPPARWRTCLPTSSGCASGGERRPRRMVCRGPGDRRRSGQRRPLRVRPDEPDGTAASGPAHPRGPRAWCHGSPRRRGVLLSMGSRGRRARTAQALPAHRPEQRRPSSAERAGFVRVGRMRARAETPIPGGTTTPSLTASGRAPERGLHTRLRREVRDPSCPSRLGSGAYDFCCPLEGESCRSPTTSSGPARAPSSSLTVGSAPPTAGAPSRTTSTVTPSPGSSPTSVALDSAGGAGRPVARRVRPRHPRRRRRAGRRALHPRRALHGGAVIQRALALAPDRVEALVGVSPVGAMPTPFDDAGRGLFWGAAQSRDNRFGIIDFTTGNRNTPASSTRSSTGRSSTASTPSPASSTRGRRRLRRRGARPRASGPRRGRRARPGAGRRDRKQTWLPLYPNARLEVLANAGHYPMFETPVHLATLVNDFVSRPAAG